MYFAQLDENNMVINVIVADADFAATLPGMWVQTDIDGINPKNYAGIGFTWRDEMNGFLAPKPFSSWVLNESTCSWEAPVPRPDGVYAWNEETQSWN